MILLDTSVLIDFLRGVETEATAIMDNLVATATPFALCHIVVQEVLQGARDNEEWETLTAYLYTQRLLRAADELPWHQHAARIFFDCRRQGRTPRSAIDCLIAELALEHDAVLLQSDRDYELIAEVRPLKLLPKPAKRRTR